MVLRRSNRIRLVRNSESELRSPSRRFKRFSELPAGYDIKSAASHFEFWKGKDVPDSWKKFRILHCFGLLKVDGFRYDMAEMVLEFWSYMNSAIKMQNTDAFLLAEVYNTKEYRNYSFRENGLCMIRWRPMIN
jgi:hypothetical protein